jgi:hypothetical protein
MFSLSMKSRSKSALPNMTNLITQSNVSSVLEWSFERPKPVVGDQLRTCQKRVINFQRDDLH